MKTVTTNQHLIQVAKRRATDLSRSAAKLADYLDTRADIPTRPGTDGRILVQIDALQNQLQDIRDLLVG